MVGKKKVKMKSEEQIKKADRQCEAAQVTDDPRLCPIYSDDEPLDCLNCTCRDVFNWILKGF